MWTLYENCLMKNFRHFATNIYGFFRSVKKVQATQHVNLQDFNSKGKITKDEREMGPRMLTENH